MKAFLLIPLVTLSFLLPACETVVVDRYPARRSAAYVERDDYHRRHRPDDRDVVVVNPRPDYRRETVVVNPRPNYRRETVVVNPRPAYRPNVEVRYYSDSRGRYYIRDGRRIYVNAGVHY